MPPFLRALPVLALLCPMACVGVPAASFAPMERAHWVALDVVSRASLRGLCVVDERVLWASGSAGTVLRSVDSGASWSTIQVPGAEEMDFRDVHALDERRAWVMGITEPACVLRTLDGGSTWETVFESRRAGDFFDSLTFFDERRACLFGDPVDGVFTVLCSSDGGASWQRVGAQHLPPAKPGEAGFAASGTCIAALPNGQAWIGTGGEHARVLRTSDYGKSWDAVETPMLAGGSAGIYSVAFRAPQDGVLVGGDYAKPAQALRNVALSFDGGSSWEGLAAGASLGGYRSAVAYLPGRVETLVAVGREGSDYSIDGGRNWLPLGRHGYYALAFSPNGLGFAVGAEGRMARLEFSKAP